MPGVLVFCWFLFIYFFFPEKPAKRQLAYKSAESQGTGTGLALPFKKKSARKKGINDL